jgi:hypothetical protein
MYRYGLTLEQVIEAYIRQDKSCAICKKPLKIGRGSDAAHVDHDHETGRFRGILCYPCNANLDRYLRYREAIHDYIGLAEQAFQL